VISPATWLSIGPDEQRYGLAPEMPAGLRWAQIGNPTKTRGISLPLAGRSVGLLANPWRPRRVIDAFVERYNSDMRFETWNVMSLFR
jgi:hypothetical protein